MELNSPDFTGEFAGSLSGDYQIPKKSDQYSYGMDSGTFTSPLATMTPYVEYSNCTVTDFVTTPKNQPTDIFAEEKNMKRKSNIYRPPTGEGLPVELSKQLQALFCALCAVKMNSPMSAKMHYESKNHDKKVNGWLLEWSRQTGEPVPKRERKEGPVGPNAFHCPDCDLPLTSLQHASQHYLGKRHRMVVAQRVNPTGSGYYGPDGKWIRV